jgi:hypothetical protein
LRIDWLINRACKPTWLSPISPSSSCREPSRDRVDDDHVDRVALDQHLANLHRFFAAAGLADQQRVQFDAQLLSPARVKGVFGVDDRRDPALSFELRRRRAVPASSCRSIPARRFDDPAARNPLAAQRHVEAERAGRNPLDRQMHDGTQRHDRPFAKRFSICCRAFRSSTFW